MRSNQTKFVFATIILTMVFAIRAAAFATTTRSNHSVTEKVGKPLPRQHAKRKLFSFDSHCTPKRKIKKIKRGGHNHIR